MLFVESAQAPAAGPLFDVARGDLFRPNEAASRLVAAIALVRAAGLRAEAEARAGAVLAVSDQASIPFQLRGYVAVALERGFLAPIGSEFRPAAPLTRLALAHAMVVEMQLFTR
jgi:hypothetical protein